MPSIYDPAYRTVDYFRVVLYCRWLMVVVSGVVVGLLAAVAVLALTVGGEVRIIGMALALIALAYAVYLLVWSLRRRRYPFRHHATDLNPKLLRTPRHTLIGYGLVMLMVAAMCLPVVMDQVFDGLLLIMLLMVGLIVLAPLIIGPALWGYPRYERIAARHLERHPDQLRALQHSAAQSQTVGQALISLRSWTPKD